MRILHLASEYPPQAVHGLGRFVHDLAVAQAAAGDEVHVVANSLSGRDSEGTRHGVHVHRVAFPPPPRAPQDVTTVTQFNVQVMERAAPLIADGRPDVINLHDWLTVPGGIPLAEVYGLPIVFTVHDTAHGKHFGRLESLDRYMADLETWGAQAADRVICCSRTVERELVDTYLVERDRIRIVPCGVDARTFEVTATPAHRAAFRTVVAEPEAPIVLFLGRLDPEKGLEVLINAVPLVCARVPAARFVIVGRGLLDASLREYVQQRGLGDNVCFTGYVAGAPLALLLGVADVMVVPSTYEPFGIVALEGMIHRVPLVVSNSTGLAEIVTDGVDGRMFATNVAHDLAERVVELLNDPPARRRLGEAGYRTATERYAWPQLAALTRTVYEEAISAPPPRDRRTIRPPAFKTAEPRAPHADAAVLASIAPWIVVVPGRTPGAAQRTIASLVEHTRAPHHLLAVDTGHDRALTGWLANVAHDGHLARLVVNAPGTMPRDARSAALVQALQLLNEELVEHLVWVLGDVAVRPNWLEAGLAVLRALPPTHPIVVLGPPARSDDGAKREVAGVPVVLAPYAPSSVWLVHRSVLARFGLPPVGFGDADLGGPDGHYTMALHEAGSCFVVLDGMVEVLAAAPVGAAE